jgi:hypothetical protein
VISQVLSSQGNAKTTISNHQFAFEKWREGNAVQLQNLRSCQSNRIQCAMIAQDKASGDSKYLTAREGWDDRCENKTHEISLTMAQVKIEKANHPKRPPMTILN